MVRYVPDQPPNTLDFRIPPRRAMPPEYTGGLGETRDFYSPGSLLNVTLDRHHPITYGMPGEIAIWSEGSPAWEVESGDAKVLARYPPSGILASGWLLGEKYLSGKAALLDVRLGHGHVILFGMRPQYRAQSYQSFKMFFNALMYR